MISSKIVESNKYYSNIIAILQLVRADRPIGSLLLLWPTLIALCFAYHGLPNLRISLIYILGVFIMRSAGCAINDYVDRDLDQHVTRTKMRPLANGKISPNTALQVIFILLGAALYLALQLRTQTLLFAMFGLFIAVFYPFAKRITSYPQFILGLAFSWSIPMVFVEACDNVPSIAWLLYAANICWVIAYDTMYAMADMEDDLLIGIKSTAITFGMHVRPIVLCLYILSLMLFAYVGYLEKLYTIYYMLLLVLLSLVIYKYKYLANAGRAQYFTTFLQNNYYGMLLLLAVMLGVFRS